MLLCSLNKLRPFMSKITSEYEPNSKRRSRNNSYWSRRVVVTVDVRSSWRIWSVKAPYRHLSPSNVFDSHLAPLYIRDDQFKRFLILRVLNIYHFRVNTWQVRCDRKDMHSRVGSSPIYREHSIRHRLFQLAAYFKKELFFFVIP